MGWLSKLFRVPDTATATPPSRRHGSLENPNVSIADASIWNAAGSLSMSVAGVPVNEGTALSFSPIWSGVSQIAGDIAQTPLFVYRRTADNGKERYADHPAYRLLRRKSNEYMTAYRWVQCAVAQAILHGNHYSWIRRGAAGEPLELIPIEPTKVTPTWVGAGDNLRLVYKVQISGTQREFPADSIFHLAGLTLNGTCGLSLIAYAANSLGRGIAAEAYGARFFGNGASPSGVLQHPGQLTAEAADRLSKQWQSRYGGENQFRVAVLEEGMSWNPMGIDPERAQMIATLEFSVKDAARFLNIPAHRIGDNSKSSYNSLEQENKSYYQTTLGPWFAAIREEAADKLLTEQEKDEDTVTVEELRVSVLRADASARSAYYHSALLDGWMSRDEVRALENMNPIPGGEGAKFYSPLNMDNSSDPEPDDEPAPEPQAEPVEDNDRQSLIEAAERCLGDALRRTQQRMLFDRTRVAKSGPDAYNRWLRHELAERHGAIVSQILEPGLGVCKALGRNIPMDAAQRVLEWYRVEFERCGADGSATMLGTSNIMEVLA